MESDLWKLRNPQYEGCLNEVISGLRCKQPPMQSGAKFLLRPDGSGGVFLVRFYYAALSGRGCFFTSYTQGVALGYGMLPLRGVGIFVFK